MFNPFKKSKQPENLNEAVEWLKKLEGRVDTIAKELTDFREKSRAHVQKVGVIRFNPFNDVGGDQSFSIALLDENNNGFVFTSLYSREGTRVYAKSIEQGRSKYQLSGEEKEAIQSALGASNPKS